MNSGSGGGSNFWMGVQTFSKDPHTAWAPGARAPTLFYNSIFTDIGVLLDPVRVHHRSHS